MAQIEIREVDLVKKIVFTSDDRSLPITDLFNDHGQETRDYNAAVMCIAGRPGEWLSVKLGRYSRNALQ